MTMNTRSHRGIHRLAAVALVAGSMTLAGCSNAVEGGAAGAGVGALAGLGIGSLFGSAGKGAAIGAISGAAVGGVIGDQNQRNEQQHSQHRSRW